MRRIGTEKHHFKQKNPIGTSLILPPQGPRYAHRDVTGKRNDMNTAIIKPQWSPLTIALMVLGFIIFWPIGLAVLGYILWGEKFGGSAEKAQSYWNKGCGYMRNNKKHFGGFNRDYSSSGNAAFDDYRAEQLRRLDEERSRLDAEIDAFHEYMANLRKAKDREEFDRFMSEHRGNRQGFGDNNQNNNNWGNNA
jgi:hypothetical protein